MATNIDKRPATPTLAQVIKDGIEKELLEVHTSMPAAIVSYDAKTNLAVVCPSLKRKYKTEENAIDLPLISNVPVGHLKFGDSHIRFPVKPGNEGYLQIMERSIDKWSETGGLVDPDDPRKFALSDAVFIPQLWSKRNPLVSKGSPNSLEIRNAKSFIEVLPNGRFRISNGSEELIKLLTDLVGELLTAKVVTAIGPQQFTVDTLAKLAALLKKLETLEA